MAGLLQNTPYGEVSSTTHNIIIAIAVTNFFFCVCLFVCLLFACSFFLLVSKIVNIIASEKPSDIAYTPMELPLHMDLTYNESTPGLQLLHCLRFEKVFNL